MGPNPWYPYILGCFTYLGFFYPSAAPNVALRCSIKNSQEEQYYSLVVLYTWFLLIHIHLFFIFTEQWKFSLVKRVGGGLRSRYLPQGPILVPQYCLSSALPWCHNILLLVHQCPSGALVLQSWYPEALAMMPQFPSNGVIEPQQESLGSYVWYCIINNSKKLHQKFG